MPAPSPEELQDAVFELHRASVDRMEWGMRWVNRDFYRRVVATLPSLGLLTVAALTPPDIEVVYRELGEVLRRREAPLVVPDVAARPDVLPPEARLSLGRDLAVMVFHLGDIAARGGKEKYWRTFDHDSRAIREAKIPFYPALGNHEFMGGDRADGFICVFADHASARRRHVA